MVVVLPEFIDVPITATVNARSGRERTGVEGEIGDIQRSPLLVTDQADRHHVRGEAHVATAGLGRRGDAAGGHQLGPAQTVGNVRFVLVGGITIGVGHQDLVADVQCGAATVRAFDLAVLTEAGHRGEHHVTGSGAHHSTDHRAHSGARNSADGETGLCPLELSLPEDLNRNPPRG